MTLVLAKPIVAYLAAANAFDSSSVASYFAEEAVVFDEGRCYTGTAAIAVWMDETGRNFKPQVQAIDVSDSGDASVVTARVSGSFPGSPIVLRYTFTLSAEHIARLVVSG
ncbi:hypothetical protein D9M68_844610 [compost metagenome]